jgi:hypothetical protein
MAYIPVPPGSAKIKIFYGAVHFDVRGFGFATLHEHNIYPDVFEGRCLCRTGTFNVINFPI